MTLVRDFYNGKKRHFNVVLLKELKAFIAEEIRIFKDSCSVKYIFLKPITNAINSFIFNCSDEWLRRVLYDCCEPLNTQTKMSFETIGVRTEVDLGRLSIRGFPSENQPIPINSRNDLELIIDETFPPYLKRK